MSDKTNLDIPNTENVIVDAIVKDLKNRMGLGHEWNRIGPDIQLEIQYTWRAIVLDVIEKGKIV